MNTQHTFLYLQMMCLTAYNLETRIFTVKGLTNKMNNWVHKWLSRHLYYLHT